MRKMKMAMLSLTILCLPAVVIASEAESSAGAGNDYRGDGIAEAGARYEGDWGLARTHTRSGPLTIASGLAVGLDRDGLSFSTSHALAHKSGIALGANFNLTIDRNGQLAVSSGEAVSQGQRYRSVGVSGATATQSPAPIAISAATGNSDAHGVVRTRTEARSSQKRPLRGTGRAFHEFKRRR